MGIINLLDSEISNKIAAGEVVERPASVVKELVENSIDAKAKKIIVEIKKGGNTYIRVTDDGCGMEKEDAVVAFLRHATSKIKTENDLYMIGTLGFRGEALSSIGAVSKVDLYTKRRNDEFGTHTICHGGEIVSDDDAGTPDGTTFIVRDIFYNVPARMKFLKKDTTEAAYITDIMTRLILAHPQISFKLISNGKEVLFSSGDGNLKNCIYSVYGKDYATSMIEVDFKTEYVRVHGLTGKGITARPNRNYQSFFVNNRYIKSPLIMRAVEEAYKNQVMIGKFPVSVLNIEINPALVDINVHPTKLEVKFSNENEIYSACYNAVKDALYRIADIPQIEKKTEKKESLFVKDSVTTKQQEKIGEFFKAEPVYEKPVVATNPVVKTEAFKEETVKTVFDTKITKVASPKLFENPFKEEKIVKKEEKPEVLPVLEKEEKQQTAAFKEEVKTEEKPVLEVPVVKEEVKTEEEISFKIVGQVFDTYIIIEKDNEMLLIDQHAAHERLNYERLLVEMENKSVYSQTLLLPCIANLSAGEMASYIQNEEFIQTLGFETEEYGNNQVIIRSVPIDAVDDEITDLFIEILSQLMDNKKGIISEKRERLLYTIACKASVKANEKLSEKEQKNLVDRVLRLENINTCPHGRPIMVKMTKTELEKQFKRIV